MDWVVIVDDDNEIRERASAILLEAGLKVTGLSSGEEFLNYIEGMIPLPDLFLLDVLMPGMSGFDTLKHLSRRNAAAVGVPVIFLTGNDDPASELEGLGLGAADFIRKPFVPEILISRVKRTIEFSRLKTDLYREVARKHEENTRITLHLVQTLAEAIDAKDTYTNGHSGRVASYSREIAKRLGYDEAGQDEIYMMALLHDVGKIGVPDWIINKTERLTDEEFAEIKKHPVVGDRILQKMKELPKLAFGARWHHERIDGRGYPDGLTGTKIPEEARIIAVADAYDAMTSNRSYRRIMPQSEVRAEIEKGKGAQFDESIADIMIAMIDEDKEYAMREHKTGDGDMPLRSTEEMILDLEKQPVLPDKLIGLKALNTELGTFLCGDVEDYLEALSIFAGSVSLKTERIEEALSNEDIKAYTNLVHSLKSSARTIGAEALSDMARMLETAGKENDIEKIRRDTPHLLADYRDIEAVLKECL